MAQLNEETGTKKDLVLYRIQSAKSDLKSAKKAQAEVEQKKEKPMSQKMFKVV